MLQLMNFNPILIVGGEPNSIFLEIFFKSLKLKKFKNPIILIASKNLLLSQMKKLNFKFEINLLDYKKLKQEKFPKNKINLINVEYMQSKTFEKILDSERVKVPMPQ